MNFGKAPLNAFIYCGAPHDPATPRAELANLCATLTELNHFHDPAITFSAQYGGPDGPKIVAQEPPYTSIYLMERENRGPDAPEQCAAYLASYLIQDLTTCVLGSELDKVLRRDDPDRPLAVSQFRVVGHLVPARAHASRLCAHHVPAHAARTGRTSGPLHRRRLQARRRSFPRKCRQLPPCSPTRSLPASRSWQ